MPVVRATSKVALNNIVEHMIMRFGFGTRDIFPVQLAAYGWLMGLDNAEGVTPSLRAHSPQPNLRCMYWSVTGNRVRRSQVVV
jgi:hypothetical protein